MTKKQTLIIVLTAVIISGAGLLLVSLYSQQGFTSLAGIFKKPQEKQTATEYLPRDLEIQQTVPADVTNRVIVPHQYNALATVLNDGRVIWYTPNNKKIHLCYLETSNPFACSSGNYQNIYTIAEGNTFSDFDIDGDLLVVEEEYWDEEDIFSVKVIAKNILTGETRILLPQNTAQFITPWGRQMLVSNGVIVYSDLIQDGTYSWRNLVYIHDFTANSTFNIYDAEAEVLNNQPKSALIDIYLNRIIYGAVNNPILHYCDMAVAPLCREQAQGEINLSTEADWISFIGSDQEFLAWFNFRNPTGIFVYHLPSGQKLLISDISGSGKAMRSLRVTPHYIAWAPSSQPPFSRSSLMGFDLRRGNVFPYITAEEVNHTGRTDTDTIIWSRCASPTDCDIMLTKRNIQLPIQEQN